MQGAQASVSGLAIGHVAEGAAGAAPSGRIPLLLSWFSCTVTRAVQVAELSARSVNRFERVDPAAAAPRALGAQLADAQDRAVTPRDIQTND